MKDPCIQCDKDLRECHHCPLAPVDQQQAEFDNEESEHLTMYNYFTTKLDQEFDE